MASEATAKPFASSIPSFMSIYDGASDINENERKGFRGSDVSGTQVEDIKQAATSGRNGQVNQATNNSFTAFHQHNDSTSTSTTANSDSTDTSPTTSVSTTDSASMTDPSPTQSPASTVSPSSVVNMEQPRFGALGGRALDGAKPFFELQRPATPQKRARNLKNLGISTIGLQVPLGSKPAPAAVVPPAPQINAPSERTSAPASPSFVKPPTPPQRRRPSALGLSIKTPANSLLPARLTIPSALSPRPATLRHFQSSPSLPMMTPSLGPKDGMRLPPLRRPAIPASHGFAEVKEEEEEQEPNFDVPQSREEKPEAYPNGPIQIYESGVDLYYEPSAEVARRYDVIMNVASEVKNPFEVEAESHRLLGNDACSEILQDKPQMSNTFGILSSDAPPTESPDTPKATPIEPPSTLVSTELREPAPSRPEYIHIPWEHNTDIVPDLYKLVKIIDDRVKQNKRVLVHCQCGVSRSASLIVAYGLYKNPGMSVQEAYDAVKKRSKWIGPNMGLIMQLQEFHSGLERAAKDPVFSKQIFGNGTPRGLIPRSPPPMSASVSGPRLTSGHRSLRIDTADRGDVSPQRASTGNIAPASAGPTSRAPGLLWDSSHRRSWGASDTKFHIDIPDVPPPPSYTETPYVDTAGHVVPMLTNVTSNPELPMIPDRRETTPKPRKIINFSRPTPERQERQDSAMHDLTAAPAVQEVEPPLMSPRATEFGVHSIMHQKDEDFGMFSPMAASFSEISLFQNQAPAPAFNKPPTLSFTQPLAAPEPLMSPRSTEFGLLGYDHVKPEQDFGLFSPLQASFPSSLQPPAPPAQQQTHVEPPNAPVLPVEDDFGSPRSAEFHMSPFNTKITEDDDFGILSPTSTSFPSNPFDSPFARSRDETPKPAMAASSSSFLPLSKPTPRSRTQTPPRRAPSADATPRASVSPSPELKARQTPSPNMPRLRAKFSSPSMREQLRLQKLQTEIGKGLPLAPLEDIMSPRVEELTKNPFHQELPTAFGIDGITTEHSKTPLSLTTDTIPEVSEKAQDPRSPAQLGISPITRNIWDVLE